MNHQDPFGLNAALNAAPPMSIQIVQPDRRKLICLERVEDNPEPDYCVHGRTRCLGCDHWCYLGPETLKVVEGGKAMPYCISCATPLVSEDTMIGNVRDSRGHA